MKISIVLELTKDHPSLLIRQWEGNKACTVHVYMQIVGISAISGRGLSYCYITKIVFSW